MTAVVVTVKIADGQMDAAQQALHEQIIPRVSKSPGFVKGYWTAGAEPHRGLSMIVFASRADAENAASMVRTSPMPPMVTLNSIEVRDVVGEA